MRKQGKLQVRLEECLAKALRAICDKKEITMSDVARQGLLRFAQKADPKGFPALEKAIEAASKLNKPVGRKAGTKLVKGKVVVAKATDKVAVKPPKASKKLPKGKKIIVANRRGPAVTR